MGSVQPDFGVLKQKIRASWTSGDYGKFAGYMAHEAQNFVDRLKIQPEMKVLDVACGTGNLAIPAALLGAEVTGVDIAPNLLQQAREKATSMKLNATFDEGDVEQLPYADGQFDLVMSMFGAMFAPRPELAASELKRVCRPGGKIAMANWTAEGFNGKMLATIGRHAPPSRGIPSPLLWGNEATVKDRLGDGTSSITTTRRMLQFDYPFSPKGVVAFFREHFGQAITIFSNLDTDGQNALTADLEKFWTEHNQASGQRTLVDAEYLEVIATKS